VGDDRWSSLANNNFNYSYCQNKLGYWGNLIHLVSLAFFLSWIELGFVAIIVKKCVYRFRMQLNVWRNQQMKISLAWWRPSKDISIDSHHFNRFNFLKTIELTQLKSGDPGFRPLQLPGWV
jgi:hypothetical protein